MSGTSSLARRALVPVALIHVLLAVSAASAADGSNSKIVLVLYPDGDDGRPGNVAVDRAIRMTFASASKNVEVHSEHLDVSRTADPDYHQTVADFLRRKYAGRRIDLVIAGLATGLDFALKYREHVFPGAPIIFCAVDQREVNARKLPRDVVGLPIKMDLAATLDVALTLHPGTRRVFVITGKAKFDVQWQAEARAAFAPYGDRVEFVYLSGLPMTELLAKVADLPEHSVVYYVHIFEDGDGKATVPAEALKLLAAQANAPIYGHVDTYVGRGIVGGRVFSFEAAGNDAATIGLRILGGETPEQIGVHGTGTNHYMFDWRQLERWGLSDKSLPAGAIIHHHEPTFWELYRWHIVGVVSLCVVEALLIIGLLVQRASRKSAEHRFQQAVEAAPNGMLMIGQDGRIILANARLEALFGYPKEELLGQPVELLLPERFRSGHPLQRAEFFFVPEARSLGTDRELFGRHKDGHEVPVEITLNPVRTGAGSLALASVIDVSERKRAEMTLQQNQQELRTLTGKLLQAQETERRRIARELHDDLNQSLALLAVHLDMLSHGENGTPARDDGRVRELSAQVKQLSSKVHDLSHQLHPAKLEQLGLVAAMRGLCTDLAKSHGMSIEFEHHDVPRMLADATALCLYRIVQESLQNVIKHSGAQRSVVTLHGEPDLICLQIRDDGKGFDPKRGDDKGGLGLVSIRERLHLVQGQMSIASKPGQGTQLEVRIPLSAKSDNQLP